MRMRSARAAIGAVAVMAGLAACASTDVTAIGPSAFQPETDEQTLWSDAARIDEELGRQEVVYDDPALEQYLAAVVTRLFPEGLAGQTAPVRVRVLRDPYRNAFALPNGSVYVHGGLLTMVENEAQLATVLGHELAHFTGRHALRRQRTAENRALAMQVVFGVLAVATAATGDANAVRAMLQLGEALSPTLVEVQVNGYSRDLEREADAQGFARVRAAGYDPREAPKVFTALQADASEAGIEEPFVFGSHPRLAERLASYEALLGEGEPAPSGRVAEAEFAAAVERVRLETARQDLEMGRITRARHALERLLAFNPSNARAHLLLGDVWRRDGDPLAARRAYEQAAALDLTFPAPHRELGLLLRSGDDAPAARDALRRFLELAPAAPDRPIIERYLRDLGGAPP